MKYIKTINEGWFSKSKYHIDKVQDEAIDGKFDDYKEKIDELFYKIKSNITSYKTFTGINQKRSDRYYNVVITYIHKLSTEFYRLCRVVNKNPDMEKDDEWYEKSKNKLFDLYDGVVCNDYHFKNLVKMLLDITYFLNMISFLSGGKANRFYFDKEYYGNTTSWYSYSFHDRVAVKKDFKEHEDMDPYGEEDWNEID